MWFDPFDVGDSRVTACSMTVPVFPSDIREAPEEEGVYVLLDGDYQVLYVGQAGPRGLRAELEAKKDTWLVSNARWYLWVNTKNQNERKTLTVDWIRKYLHDGDHGTPQGSERRSEGRAKVLLFPSSMPRGTLS